jgi:hypothetical protein
MGDRPKHVALFKFNHLRICTKSNEFDVLVHSDEIYNLKRDSWGSNVSDSARKKRAVNTTWYNVGILANSTVSWKVNVFLITNSINYIR